MKKMRMVSIAFAVLCCAAWGLGSSEGAQIESKEQDNVKENAIETVAETEKKIKKLLNAGVKFALPYLMSTATEIRINSKCMQGLMMLMRGVMDIKDWAIKMVDAIGKPSAGILEGTAIAMGDYDECLNIVAPRRMRPAPIPPYKPNEIAFQGQYCAVQIDLPEGLRQAAMDYQAGNRSNSELANSKTFLRNLIKLAPMADVANLRLGICVPSVCNKNDLQTTINQVTNMAQISSSVIRCEIKEPRSIQIEQIVILCVIGILMLIVGAGTSAEIYIRFKTNAPVDDVQLEKQVAVVKSLLVFSAARNLRKLFSLIPNDAPMISSLRGIKVLIACLYIVVWTYASPDEFHFYKYRSAFHFFEFMEQWWFTIFANASAAIDTFFLIAGLQVSYRLWRKSKNGNVKIHIPKFILKWYIRFTLSQVLVIALLLCLPLLGHGPIWDDVVGPVIENCKQRWWMNALVVNNFFSSDTTCLPHTWLICCLMHLLILAPILLFILSKSTSLGIFVNVILILGSSTAIAMVTLMNELPPTPAFYFMSFLNKKVIWQKLFIQAYDHIGSFCIGMLLGVFFNRYKTINLRKRTITVGWFSAIICNLAVICGLYGYRHGEIMGLPLSAFYASVHRIVWSLGLSWIIFACAYGYAGFVNTFLSWKLLIPFERLSNFIFLLHPLILYLHGGQLRERLYMGHLDQIMYATAYIVFTIAIAVFCYVTCVSPFKYFEKKTWYYSTSENHEKDGSENQEKKTAESISSSIDKDEKFQYFRNSLRVQEKKEKLSKT